jgi:hypothetical protein
MDGLITTTGHTSSLTILLKQTLSTTAFLNQMDIEKMSFMSLYHASWDAKTVLKLDLKNLEETYNKYDTACRDKNFISPE